MRNFFFILILCLSCKEKSKPQGIISNDITQTQIQNQNQNQSQNEIYNFDNPQQFKLESSLKEISGLSYYNGNIYTHNDEEGILFKLNPNNGKTISTYNFGIDGDYEGIEVIDNKAIIVKSNGNLVFFNLDTNESNILKNKLSSKNNVEGLGYLSSENKLLIACKGNMLKGDKSNKEKAVYSYSLANQKLNTKPFLTIKDEDLKKQLKKQFSENNFSDRKIKKLKSRAIEFSPSGIAVHPITNDYYLISARGSTLIILNAKKEISDIIFLNENELPQPEGICFDKSLNLYISTEIKEGSGRLYRYQKPN